MNINGQFCINNYLNYFLVRRENVTKIYRKGSSNAAGLGKKKKQKIIVKTQIRREVRKASKILFLQCNPSPMPYLWDSLQYVLSLFQGYRDRRELAILINGVSEIEELSWNYTFFERCYLFRRAGANTISVLFYFLLFLTMLLMQKRKFIIHYLVQFDKLLYRIEERLRAHSIITSEGRRSKKT